MSMLKTILPLCTALVFVGCKSKTEAETPAVKTEAKAVKKTGPDSLVFAASAHVRMLDSQRGQIVGRLQLQKAVRMILFSPDGATAYLACSDGVRAVDTSSFKVLSQLTERPARHIRVSADGKQLHVLEHFVITKEDGSRVAQPFSLVTVNLQTGAEVSREVVGERILYAHRAPGADGRTLRVAESGEILTGNAGADWNKGTEIDVRDGLEPTVNYRVRKTVAQFKTHLFVPIEGDIARVMDIDSATGSIRYLSLGRAAAIRGLGVTPDGQTLLVNTGIALEYIDLATGDVSGTALVLPGGLVGCDVSSDGKYVYFAQVRDADGGAVLVVDFAKREIVKKIHLDDITPWAIGVAPQSIR